MSADAPTPAQIEMFNLVAEFAVEALVGIVTSAYDVLGPKYVAGDALPDLLLPVLQSYFNTCAHSIESGTDIYLTAKLDRMMAIRLDRPSHPQDILQHVALLTLALLNAMGGITTVNLAESPTDRVSPDPTRARQTLTVAIMDRRNALDAIKSHIDKLSRRHIGLASQFTGCPRTHIHTPLAPSELVYQFAYKKPVQTTSGLVHVG